MNTIKRSLDLRNMDKLSLLMMYYSMVGTEKVTSEGEEVVWQFVNWRYHSQVLGGNFERDFEIEKVTNHLYTLLGPRSLKKLVSSYQSGA